MTRASILGVAFACSTSDINENRYQSTRTPIPVWTFGDFYFVVASPSELKKLDKRFPNAIWAEYCDAYAQTLAAKMSPARKIYRSTGNEQNVEESNP